MLHLNIKPQNRIKTLIIFVLGGIWGIIDMWMFKGGMAFIVDGIIFLMLMVILGNITSWLLNKIDYHMNLNKNELENILDSEDEYLENQKDQRALNLGIIWSLILIVLSLF